MRIAILGVGSLGTLLGAYLSDVARVVLVGSWAEQIEAVQRHGVTVMTTNNERRTHQVTATSRDHLPTEQDIAIVAVKSYQTREAATAAAQMLAPEGMAITLQNGVGNLAALDASCGLERTTAGVTTQGARLLEPGVVLDSGAGQTLLGCRDTLSTSAVRHVLALANAFNDAGLDTRTVTDIDGLLWSKLAVNAAINPLTALLDVRNGALLAHAGLVEIMTEAAREAAAVASAQGYALSGDDLVSQALDVASRTAANESSMLQDMRRGRPTEIDAICGAIVAKGHELAVPTPVNERLLSLVRRKEAGDLDRLLTPQITLQAFLNIGDGG